MANKIFIIIRTTLNVSLLLVLIMASILLLSEDVTARDRTGIPVSDHGIEEEQGAEPADEPPKESAAGATVVCRCEKVGDMDSEIPLLFLSIPGDRQKEERINRMMADRYQQLLPSIAEGSLDEALTPHITYHSERYLCFRYAPVAYLPEGCDCGQLHFTLDMEKERWIEYPAVYYDGEAGFRAKYGDLYKEKKEYSEKTVKEQNDLRGETGYRVCEAREEFDGITIPCAAVEGMEDGEKQERINQILQEPFQTLASRAEWEDEDAREWNFQDVKIYVAYKSEKWLSVVYSVLVDNNPDELSDGIAEIGVTVDMESGERVMLDDLFELDRLLDWTCTQFTGSGEKVWGARMVLGSVLTEKEVLDWYWEKYGEKRDGFWALHNYDRGGRTSFYLYEGKLVLMLPHSFSDSEIPLPEVYEYLKVDPWYD